MTKFAEGLKKKTGPCISKPGCTQVRICKAIKSNWKLKEPLTTLDASWLLLPERLPQSRNGVQLEVGDKDDKFADMNPQ